MNRNIKIVEVINTVVARTGTVLFGTLLALLLLSVLSMRVSGSSRVEAVGEKQYHELEMRLLEVVDMKLTEAGYYHSGLTLNSVVDSDGSRRYYVGIHHERITCAGEEEWQEILRNMETISFPVDRCSIQYKLVP